MIDCLFPAGSSTNIGSVVFVGSEIIASNALRCIAEIIFIRIVILNVRVVILSVTAVILDVTVVILRGTLVIYNETLVIITFEQLIYIVIIQVSN